MARGLLDYRTPFGTRELAAETASSPAMISRVASLLEPDEIITKEGPRGRIVSVDWEALARRWAMDYDFASSNALTDVARTERGKGSARPASRCALSIRSHWLFRRESPGTDCGATLGYPFRQRSGDGCKIIGTALGRDWRQCSHRGTVRPRGF